MNINRIPKNIRDMFPKWLKRLAVRGYVRVLMNHGVGLNDKPRISFAGILPPEGSFIRGGKVKLTHLRKSFGEYHKKFNILYLVSSTLPGYADIWVSEAKRKGVKVVWNQNGIGCPAWTPIWKKINESMRPLSQADYVIYQSAFAKGEADALVARREEEYTVITNCCDTEVFYPLVEHQETIPLKLLVMGTHMTREKVLIPLEALKLLIDKEMNVKLLIYGPCEWSGAENDISEKIKELGLENHVIRRGKFLQDEAPQLYRDGHIFIHLKHMDSSPTAILEAMASGLPVVGSKSGGVAEWIAPSAGILLDVPISREKLYYPSREDVARAVTTIAPDWQKWSKGARDHAVVYFGVPDWVDQHKKVFNHALGIND
jgi:glycosyltransferase involved in cell wall biosynthesis